MRCFLPVIFLLGSVHSAEIALTPPMGWASWNSLGKNINEEVIHEIADAMVSSGLRDAGYVYLTVDDGWQGDRDAQGNLQGNPALFPSGMKALGDYIHSKGLKYGIYTSVGEQSCLGLPGSYGNEERDAATFIEWGADSVKDDCCYSSGLDQEACLQKMQIALLKSPRPIVFDLDTGPLLGAWKWGLNVGNLWRTGKDIFADWTGSILPILDDQATGEQAPFAGPGHWNDPDMLEVGNGDLTEAECRSHFSLWCLLAAPLNAGNDVRIMPSNIQNILLNTELIAVDQDQLGYQGKRIKKDGLSEVWARDLADGSKAVLLFNRGEQSIDITVNWVDLGLSGQQSLRDLWAHQDLGIFGDSFTGTVSSHDVLVLKVTPLIKKPLNVVAARMTTASTIVKLYFSKTLDRATVGELSNYIADQSIFSAKISDNDQRIVLLTTSGPISSLMLSTKSADGDLLTPQEVKVKNYSRSKTLKLKISSNTSIKFPKGEPSSLTLTGKPDSWGTLVGSVLEISTNKRDWRVLYRFDHIPALGDGPIEFFPQVGTQIRIKSPARIEPITAELLLVR